MNTRLFGSVSSCLLIALAGICATGNAFATNYFVDYAGGSDTANGTSTGTAWKHCPGDAKATNTAGGTVLTPGDTVHFKGGVQYVLVGGGGIALNSSGTAAKPITYDGNSDGSWGTGRANIRGSFDSTGMQANGPINVFQGNQALTGLNFLSLDIGPAGGSLVLPADPGSSLPPAYAGGIVNNYRFTSVTISNCYFHELGYWYNTKPMDSGSISGSGISTRGYTNVVITNCEFTKTHTAIEIALTGTNDNLEISGCEIHDYVVWGIDLGVTSENAWYDNIYIHNNRLHDYDRYYSDGYTPWQGYGGYGSWPHCDGIFLRGDTVSSFHSGTNINIYANDFYASAPYTGGTAPIYMTGSGSANIYNNVFNNSAAANGAITFSDPDPGVPFVSRIYNNTFYCNYRVQIMIGGKPDGTWPVQTNIEIDVQNNIFYDACTNSGNNFLVYINTTTGDAKKNIFFNNNLYRSLNLDLTFSDWPNYSGEMNLDGSGKANWGTRKLLGWDSNSITADPGFTTASLASYLTNNYRLAFTNGVAAKGGTNFSAVNLRGLSIDKDGNPRPASGPWSLGAYQAGGFANTGNPPSTNSGGSSVSTNNPTQSSSAIVTNVINVPSTSVGTKTADLNRSSKTNIITIDTGSSSSSTTNTGSGTVTNSSGSSSSNSTGTITGSSGATNSTSGNTATNLTTTVTGGGSSSTNSSSGSGTTTTVAIPNAPNKMSVVTTTF